MAKDFLDNFRKPYSRLLLFLVLHRVEAPLCEAKLTPLCAKTRDHNVALSFGRPFLIDMADVDVEPLSEEDFYEESREQVANGDFEYDVDCTARPSIHMFFIMELIQLSIIRMHPYPLSPVSRKFPRFAFPSFLPPSSSPFLLTSART